MAPEHHHVVPIYGNYSFLILDRVYFEVNSAVVSKASEPLLEAIAQTFHRGFHHILDRRGIRLALQQGIDDDLADLLAQITTASSGFADGNPDFRVFVAHAGLLCYYWPFNISPNHRQAGQKTVSSGLIVPKIWGTTTKCSVL